MYPISLSSGNHAFKTGIDLGWDVELFEGVDGKTVASDEAWNLYNVPMNRENKKCSKMLDRPGVRGCFLSHWKLWNLCVDTNDTIGVFEHDVEFLKPPLNSFTFDEFLRLEGFEKQKSKPAGEWYEGTRGYIINPIGAKKLIDWVKINGCLPADVNVGSNILKIELDSNKLIRDRTVHVDRNSKHTNSFTWNLGNMK